MFVEKIKVEKKMGHHFDVEFCQESIFGIHKCNGAPQTPLWTQLLFFPQFVNLKIPT